VDIETKSYRIIAVKLVFEDKFLNVITTYVSQVGCDGRRNKEIF